MRTSRKPKVCLQCNESFIPNMMGAKVCSPICAMKYVQSLPAKPKLKSAPKTLAQLKKSLQRVFNSFIRLRDAGDTCISCADTKAVKEYHAGHYRSVGAHPELRFHQHNVHKQCADCNRRLHGNLIEYRKRLKEKIGECNLDWLEGHHEPRKYTVTELTDLIHYYKQKIKQLA